MYKFLFEYLFSISLGIYIELLVHMVGSSCDSWRTVKLFSMDLVPFYHKYMRVTIFLHLHQYLSFFVLKNYKHSSGCEVVSHHSLIDTFAP